MTETNGSQKKDRRSRTLLLVIIGILLVINGILIYNLVNKDDRISFLNEKLTEEEQDLKELQDILDARQKELNGLKGKNEELDKVIARQEEEIKEKAARIEKLLKSGKLSKAELESARAEIAALKGIVDRYSVQLDSIATVNRILREDLDNEKSKNMSLEEANKKQGETIKMAQRLKAGNVTVTGVILRKGGKEAETSRANRIEKIKVTFMLVENEVAESGPRDIYLKINGPDGSTLAIQETGSGKFEYEGQESLYTTKESVQYDKAKKQVTMLWGKDGSWTKGKYVIELYTEGYKLGSGELNLR